MRRLGAPVGLLQMVALEALAVAAAVLVPGAAGIQEMGYVDLGALHWVSPVLPLSQWQEARRVSV